MLLDGLRSLFLQALRFDGNDATVLVTTWNEEINYIQSVFDNMTDKKSKPPIRTKADRIRSMTDDELAEKLTSLPCSCCPDDTCSWNCKQTWLNWLKQEING